MGRNWLQAVLMNVIRFWRVVGVRIREGVQKGLRIWLLSGFKIGKVLLASSIHPSIYPLIHLSIHPSIPSILSDCRNQGCALSLLLQEPIWGNSLQDLLGKGTWEGGHVCSVCTHLSVNIFKFTDRTGYPCALVCMYCQVCTYLH